MIRYLKNEYIFFNDVLKISTQFVAIIFATCSVAILAAGSPVPPSMTNFIKRADTVVSKHALIAGQPHRVTWADIPTTIPSCSVALRDDLRVIDKSDSEKTVIYTLICRGTVRWTRTFRGRIVFAGELIVADEAIPVGTTFSKNLFRRQTDSQSGVRSPIPAERFKAFWGASTVD